MGKNHRHKKMLKSEKSKVKLKVKPEKTKFLPKGLNETKLDYKIKPIILPQQLKEKDHTELLSNRKLNVKDILSRLRHHNINMRHDALNELKQIVMQHSEDLISLHLSQVMHGVPPLLLDDNHGVRKTVMTTLQIMLKEVPSVKIAPFCGILSSYLRCAMTNINRSIQEDSLGFLAILLENIPDMIADESHKILPNLFALISKFKVDSLNSGRTLSVNLNSKLTSVKWHVLVLSGIYGFLKAVVAVRKGKLSETRSLSHISANRQAAKFVPVIHNNYISSRIAYNSEVLTNPTTRDDVLESNLGTLMALLFEMWIEVAPDKNLREIDTYTALNTDAATILSCILNVMHLLYDRLLMNNEGDITLLRETYFTKECTQLLLNVFSSFPYTKVENNAKQENTIIQKLLTQHLYIDNKFVRENLIICYLFANLNPRLVRAAVINNANRVLDFIQYCLTTRGRINAQNIDSLVLVTRKILFDNIEWHSKVDVKNILVHLVDFLTKSSDPAKHSTIRHKNDGILDVLCEVSQLSHLNRIEEYQAWLESVSEALCTSQIPENILNALLLVGKQKNTEFLAGLDKRMPRILENYNNITVVDVQPGQQYDLVKLKILCLFYYLPNYSQEGVAALKVFEASCTPNEASLVKLLLEKHG